MTEPGKNLKSGLSITQIGAILAIIVAMIAIIKFVTGRESLPELLPDENPITPNTTLLKNRYNQYGFDLIWAGGESNEQDNTKLTQTRITSIVVENQSSVKVYYDWYNGVLSGTLSGHTLSGTWGQDNGQGNFELTFAPDFSSAKGWWDSKNSPGQHDFYIQSP